MYVQQLLSFLSNYLAGICTRTSQLHIVQNHAVSDTFETAEDALSFV